ncbi:hypothetical protein AABB24_014516 [Solanum stoloniferum]|uniref:Uncharacterized protein n=3 Tax=Solanum TaxID=4107 RepID=A0AAF0UCA8_SOLVR|nr:uncharacterized protein LOC125826457 [Solanum verrucosum]WMV43209.1 hypothetical protein MTR67_036594 [Solanum verrucosum]
MDLVENPEEVEEKRKEISGSARLRRLLGILVFFCAFFTISFSVLYLAVFLGNLSISSPISLPSQCKIVSSSVDLRSSKVCELGLLNYKAKHVLYPSERKKFRCHYDYYWASVFKVEYMDHSGQARSALAEAPNEALPSDCRPNFSGAWLTKDKFEVNKTYECWYTLGISKVHIYQAGFFDCDAKDPSTIEMFIRYLILFMRILKSWYVSGVLYWHWRWEAVAGVIAGFCTSIMTVILFALLRKLFSCIYQLSVVRRFTLPFNKVRLRRVCFLLAYVSFTSWLAVQYFRRIGLPEIAVYYSM